MSTALQQNNKDWSNLFKGWHRKSLDVDAHLAQLLEAAVNHLNLEVGIISHITGNAYTVEHFFGGGLSKGAEFQLGDTYCSITTKKQDLVAINHMGISEYFRHPCYEAFKLESYIGTPIFLNGELYGTVNFSSPTPRETPFTFEDKVFVQLVGESVNWSLHLTH